MKVVLRTSVICAVAILLNILSAFLFYDCLHFPLFMDTIFTVTVVFYCGLFPGLAVGVLYNICNVFFRVLIGMSFQPIIMAFGICGAIIAFVTWFFARKHEEFKISLPVTALYLVLIAVTSSFCVVIVSGFIDFIKITFFYSPDMQSPVKQFTDSFLQADFSLLVSCILGQIPVSFIDRLITTFLGYGVYKLMARFLGEPSWR